MDLEYYRRRLLEEEERLLKLYERAQEEARETAPDDVRDGGDESVADELKDGKFQEAETYWAQLQQVRAALRRIDGGTYGQCLADGRPIDEKRLRATPWAAYCLEHQQAMEEATPARTPSL